MGGIVRALNAQLLYLAWVWRKLGLRTAVELQVQVENLGEATMQIGWGDDERAIREPPGVPVPAISLTRELLPWELVRASVRHAIVRDFGDRLHQAFGYSTATLLFRVGWLHGLDGLPLGVAIAGNGLWNQAGEQQANLYNSGRILDSTKNVVGFFVDGVVLDKEGGALAALEIAPGTGLPDDFLAQRLSPEPRPKIGSGYSETPTPDNADVELPAPSGR